MLTEALAAAALAAGYIPGPVNAQVHIGDFTYPGTGTQSVSGGYTNPETGDIYMQAREPFTLAHEKFHLLNYQSLTDRDRRRLTKIMRLKGPWDQGTGVGGGGLKSPSEWAADYYAAVVTHLDPSREGVSSYATIGPKRLKRFRRELKLISQRHEGLPRYK